MQLDPKSFGTQDTPLTDDVIRVIGIWCGTSEASLPALLGCTGDRCILPLRIVNMVEPCNTTIFKSVAIADCACIILRNVTI